MVGEVFGEPGFLLRQASFWGKRLALPVFSSQKAFCERRPGQESQALGLGHGHEFALNSPIEQVIRWLLRDDAIEAEFIGYPE